MIKHWVIKQPPTARMPKMSSLISVRPVRKELVVLAAAAIGVRSMVAVVVGVD